MLHTSEVTVLAFISILFAVAVLVAVHMAGSLEALLSILPA